MLPKDSHTWVPLTPQGKREPVPIIQKAEGEFIFTSEGKAYLDGIASWWTMIHGHRHPKLMAALVDQTKKLDHVMLGGILHEEGEELSKLLLQKLNNQFAKVYFSDNGSNSVEIALKVSVHSWALRKRPTKTSFVIFSTSYHGDSLGAMNVSGSNVFNSPYNALRFPVEECIAPNCHACPWKKKPKNCSLECLEQVEDILKSKAENIAGILIEPLVFGAFGMIFYESKVLNGLRKLADKYEVYLIFDEVFTGMGRLGEFTAAQKAEVNPDLICLAKGLTGGVLALAVTLVKESIYLDFVGEDLHQAFFHAHTMTGNPLACRLGIESIRLWEEQISISQKEHPLAKELERLRDSLISWESSQKISHLRSQGGILAFEISGTDIAEDEYLLEEGRKFCRNLWDKGLFLRPLGNTIYLTPPNITSSKSFEIVSKALGESLKELQI